MRVNNVLRIVVDNGGNETTQNIDIKFENLPQCNTTLCKIKIYKIESQSFNDM